MDVESMAEELFSLLRQMPRGTPRGMLAERVRGEALLLGYLVECGGVAGPGEMSRMMHSSTARVAAALGSMERKGWISRHSDCNDRRRTRVSITPEGRAFAKVWREQVLTQLRHTLEALGEEDAMAYIRIQRRISSLADQEPIH